jgi:hypothetical protein
VDCFKALFDNIGGDERIRSPLSQKVLEILYKHRNLMNLAYEQELFFKKYNYKGFCDADELLGVAKEIDEVKECLVGRLV